MSLASASVILTNNRRDRGTLLKVKTLAAAVASSTQIDLSWDAPIQFKTVDEYFIRYGISGSDFTDEAVDAAPSTGVSITGLTTATHYIFGVRTRTGGRLGPWSFTSATTS